MNTMTIEDRVRRGAHWLDRHYPLWWKSIDLGILNIANCHRCVLGQVYTDHIPEAERGQILAQVITAMPKYRMTTFRENMTTGDEGGYQVLLEHHELLGMSAGLGFSTDYRMARGMTGPQEMAALTDEWTRLILSRRLADHPDIRQLSCDLVEMR